MHRRPLPRRILWCWHLSARQGAGIVSRLWWLQLGLSGPALRPSIHLSRVWRSKNRQFLGSHSYRQVLRIQHHSTMFTERPLPVGSSSGTLQAGCSQLRLSMPAQHVHAARLGRGKRPSLGIAAAPRTPRAVASSQTVVVEEEVDAIAVLERPGAVPSTHFEHHDQAMQQLQELMAFNTELNSAIEDADFVLEQTSWSSLTLPVSLLAACTMLVCACCCHRQCCGPHKSIHPQRQPEQPWCRQSVLETSVHLLTCTCCCVLLLLRSQLSRKSLLIRTGRSARKSRSSLRKTAGSVQRRGSRSAQHVHRHSRRTPRHLCQPWDSLLHPLSLLAQSSHLQHSHSSRCSSSPSQWLRV